MGNTTPTQEFERTGAGNAAPTYTVQSGDSLSKIAAAFGVDPKLLQRGNGIKNPNSIQVGQTLTLEPDQVMILPGDNFSKIAKELGMSISELKKLNPQIPDINTIKAGGWLRINESSPALTAPAPQSTPATTSTKTPKESFTASANADLKGLPPSIAAIIRKHNLDYTSEDFRALRKHMKLREGYKTHTYTCTAGHETFGIGHKIIDAQERAKIQNTPQNECAQLAENFFTQDIQTALSAAATQARQLGMTDPDFINALASVNFQLGTAWHTKEFPKAWKHMENGDFAEAAREIARNGAGNGPSDWLKDTPVRVKDFQIALNDIAEKLEGPTLLAENSPPAR